MITKVEELVSGPTQSDWPLFGLVDDVRATLAGLVTRREHGALATLIGVDGPSPRPLGAQMLIDCEGHAVGYVSGGCVEGNIALLAQEVIATGVAASFVFGADSPYKDIMLICGTRIEVLIEPIGPDNESIQDLITAFRTRRPYTRQTAADKQGRSYWCDYQPTSRLIVFGSDPVALATAQLAHTVGLEVILVRDHGPKEAPAGLGANYLAMSARGAFSALKLDPWTALITTTHDLDQDHEVLSVGLASESFYVGALGSKRRLDDRRTKLLAAGLTAAQIDRLHAPVGLPIGAATPYEIAISILGDVIKARRMLP
jgi:xanthine dehydrogenase accessory factor